jgi:hypothetical protein
MRDNDNILTMLIVSAWINILLIICLTNASDFASSELSIVQDTIQIDDVKYAPTQEQCIYASRASCERKVVVLYTKKGDDNE